MRDLANTKDRQKIDLVSQKNYSIPGIVLMENAARSCWEAITDFLSQKTRGQETGIVVIAGPGNNGGDGLSIARRAGYAGFPVIVVHCGEWKSDLARVQYEMLAASGFAFCDWKTNWAAAESAIKSADLVIDAMFGSGLSRSVGGDYLPIVSLINSVDRQQAFVISVDIPSGLFAGFNPQTDICVQADLTCAVSPADIALYTPAYRSYAGRIVHVDAGFPPSACDQYSGQHRLCEVMDKVLFETRLEATAYKNSRGHVAVYAGSVQWPGAAVLAAKAAGLGAAGRVSLMADEKIIPLLGTQLVSTVIGNNEGSLPPGATALLVGCGWGQEPGRRDLLRKLISQQKPMVLDADALIVMAELEEDIQQYSSIPLVMTPHPGELAIISGNTVKYVLENFAATLMEVAQKFNAVVVGKSHVTCVVHPQKGCFWVDGMTPALGTAGSGDILAGLIGAELAADGDPLRAALYGVLSHVEAGKKISKGPAELLLESLKDGLLINGSDIIDA
ncbi:MAG: NAD(P)H-hydrate epimerase [Spirochaetaceae bacterium]|nr:MAG: NAD(P)H-hydrate epimerase [Spirochaetaceae bacterium]